MTEELRTRINYFRSFEEERRQWEAAAEKALITLSEFLREAANEKAMRVMKQKDRR